MTQPYAVAEEILWLAWLDVCIDDKECYTTPQEKNNMKTTPRLYQQTGCRNNGLLGKIKRWLKIINDASRERSNNRRIWKPAVVTAPEKVHFIGSVKRVSLALQQKARKGRPDPEIMLLLCSYKLSAQSPDLLGNHSMIRFLTFPLKGLCTYTRHSDSKICRVPIPSELFSLSRTISPPLPCNWLVSLHLSNLNLVASFRKHSWKPSSPGSGGCSLWVFLSTSHLWFCLHGLCVGENENS